jgi:hypothetical protein
MSRELVSHNRPVFDQLPPGIYRTAIGLIAWFTISAWLLFDRGGDIELSLVMVSVLFLVAVMVPLLMSLAWRKSQAPDQQHLQSPSFHDWQSGDLAVWGARLRGMHAAIDMLLPFAAVAFGLTAIGLVFAIEYAMT